MLPILKPTFNLSSHLWGAATAAGLDGDAALAYALREAAVEVVLARGTLNRENPSWWAAR